MGHAVAEFYANTFNYFIKLNYFIAKRDTILVSRFFGKMSKNEALLLT
jgi:hypothetical protein